MKNNKLLVIFLVCFATLFFSLDALPFLDFPNHLTRSCIMGALFIEKLSPFHGLFTFVPQLIPYILGDVLMGATCAVVDPITTGRIWIVIGFLIVPAGMALWMRELDLNRDFESVLLLLSVYLSTNWFFLSGFYGYQLSLGLALLTLGLSERWRRRRRSLDYALYALLVAAVYLTHLAPFVCIGTIIGLSGVVRLWQRREKLSTVATLYLPLAVMSIAYWAMNPITQDGRSELAFRTFPNKLAAVVSPFIRFDIVGDSILFLTMVGALSAFAFPARRAIFSAVRTGVTAETIVISIGLFALYLVLPVSGLNLNDIDNRVIPFVSVSALFVIGQGSIAYDFSPRATRHAKLALSLLLTVNALLISSVLIPQNRDARDYLALIRQLPANETVLTVATRPSVGRVQPLRHAGALYTLFKGGMTPYLFRGDAGDSMVHFRFRGQLYRPHILWYVQGYPVPWDRIREKYSMLVVTKPYESGRFDLSGYSIIAENRVAVAYQKSGSPGRPRM